MRLPGPYGRRVPYTAILGLYWGATWTLLVAFFGAALLANGLDRARRAFAVRVAVVGLLAGAGLVATVAVVAAGVLAGVHGGWVFAAPILTVAGVLVGPAIAAALLTPPALVRLARTVAPAERPAVAAAPGWSRPCTPAPEDPPARDLDLAAYGRPGPAPFTVDSQFQRHQWSGAHCIHRFPRK